MWPCGGAAGYPWLDQWLADVIHCACIPGTANKVDQHMLHHRHCDINLPDPRISNGAGASAGGYRSAPAS
jgi:hypothetical protein